MQNSHLLLITLLHLSSLEASSLTGIAAGGSFGVGGGINVWINGRGGVPTNTDNPPPSPSDPTSNTDYTALQAWKSTITDDPNKILASWVGPNVCSYKGIYCSDSPEDASTAVVRGIDLNGANLRGTLPNDLSLLAHLSILHLNSNRLSGTIPNTFRALRFLTELDLSNNQLSGPFPTTALLLPSLIYLDLRFNSLSGEIPNELFQKPGLDAIFLNNNQFEGEVPATLWASPASVVSLANNRLSGDLPPGFGYMGGGIREMLLLNNRLTGCVPEGVGYLPEVEVLDLSYNDFTGRLPESLSCLSGIEVLNIAHNQFSGELPDLLCELKRLANLSVAYNFFSGFSQDCTRLFYGDVGFDFARNCIPGRDMQRPPPECMGVPGGGLNCMRMSAGPPRCGGGGAAVGVGVGGFGFGVGVTLPTGAAPVP